MPKSSKSSPKKKTDPVLKELQAIRRTLEKSGSWKRRLWIGMLQGVATALGATIIAGTLLYFLSRFIDSIAFQSILTEAIGQAISNTIVQ